MSGKSIQDFYPDDVARCYGCGRANEHGLQLKSYKVDYLRPTPLGPPLEVRGRVEEIKGRKVVVDATVSAEGEVCARGSVIAVQMPEQMFKGGG